MPGFPPACPDYSSCPFTGLATTATIVTYLLVAEAALLAISLIYARMRRRAIRYGVIALLAVLACPLIAANLTGMLLRLNPSYGFIGVHYSPARAAILRQQSDAMQARMTHLLLAVWAMFAVATLLATLSLIVAARRMRALRPHEHSS